MAKKETWKQCHRWAAYDVSSEGRIRTYWQMAATASTVDRSKKPMVMTPSKDDGGRLFVIVHDEDGNKKNAVLARLILDTFTKPGTKRDKVEYGNSKRSDVRLANIKYVRRGPAKKKAAAKKMPWVEVLKATTKKYVKNQAAELAKIKKVAPAVVKKVKAHVRKPAARRAA